MVWRPPPLTVPAQQSNSHFLATLSEWPPSPLTEGVQVQQRGHLEEVAAAALARRDLPLLGCPPLLALQA